MERRILVAADGTIYWQEPLKMFYSCYSSGYQALACRDFNKVIDSSLCLRHRGFVLIPS